MTKPKVTHTRKARKKTTIRFNERELSMLAEINSANQDAAIRTCIAGYHDILSAVLPAMLEHGAKVLGGAHVEG